MLGTARRHAHLVNMVAFWAQDAWPVFPHILLESGPGPSRPGLHQS